MRDDGITRIKKTAFKGRNDGLCRINPPFLLHRHAASNAIAHADRHLHLHTLFRRICVKEVVVAKQRACEASGGINV